MRNEPLATIDTPDGGRIDIVYWNPHPEEGEPDRFDAVHTAKDGTVTRPQTEMSSEACIRYLAHLAHGYAYQAGLLY